MRQFGIALGCLFLFVMAYAFQHFKAIEYGYKIEALKSQRDTLTEQARQLRLEDAYLRNPDRIVPAAQQLGLQTPQVGQVMRLENTTQDSGPAVAMASSNEVPVTPRKPRMLLPAGGLRTRSPGLAVRFSVTCATTRSEPIPSSRRRRVVEESTLD